MIVEEKGSEFDLVCIVVVTRRVMNLFDYFLLSLNYQGIVTDVLTLYEHNMRHHENYGFQGDLNFMLLLFHFLSVI